MSKPISIVMGSQSDLEIVNEAIDVLKEFRVDFEVRVLSAHRTPKELVEYVERFSKKGTHIFIAAAGGAAALAGVIASHTIAPVIGIPIETKNLKGLDSLLSTVQMPAGIPVACMAIGKSGARNAALFALEILACKDKRIQQKLFSLRKKMRRKIISTKIKL
ncbi:MAG: 5-(carboxyamino)imidazole ribonucleotide mutase [Candidatus Omnitrophica bacterium]|nr:5-(carboxyamino)imidazole ribonucleotide mutase [Candidatus Omnitrophota bacterium]